jgi:hypothetical protein
MCCTVQLCCRGLSDAQPGAESGVPLSAVVCSNVGGTGQTSILAALLLLLPDTVAVDMSAAGSCRSCV